MKDIFIFFGYGYARFIDFDSIIRLNLRTNYSLWEGLLVVLELKKYSFSLLFFEENIYIFGGYSCYDLTMNNKLGGLNLKTKIYSELSDMLIFPEGRYSGTMSVINTKFYLFGGKNSEIFFNDMWIFHTDLSYWESLTISGEVPSARYLHSAYAEGEAIILWRGSDSSELKNDLFIYNALTNYWSKISPLSSLMPRAAKGTCIVAKIYIYGRIVNSGYSGELWEFDMED